MSVLARESCPECGRVVLWGTICRFEDSEGHEFKLCSDCCPNCGDGREDARLHQLDDETEM